MDQKKQLDAGVFAVPMPRSPKWKISENSVRLGELFTKLEAEKKRKRDVEKGDREKRDRELMYKLNCDVARNGIHSGCKHGGTYTRWFDGDLQSYYLCDKCDNFKLVKRDPMYYSIPEKVLCCKCKGKLVCKYIDGRCTLLCTSCMTYVRLL
jgi:hypothetical protein